LSVYDADQSHGIKVRIGAPQNSPLMICGSVNIYAFVIC